MVKVENVYICPICEVHHLCREEAEDCLRSHLSEVRLERFFRCSKCYARFSDFHEAQVHERFCQCGE